jgi:hypothetical protein
MRNTSFSLICLLLLSAEGCSSVPVQTPETIAAREQILFQATAAFGRIGAGIEAVTWEDRGTLILTPTSIYFTGGSRAISYAMVNSVSLRALPDMLAVIRGKVRQSLLVVQVDRPVCFDGCVFNLVDDPGKASEALDIIEAGRYRVDPFGRTNGPYDVWLATGIRNTRVWWRERPAYLEARTPERKRALDDWFCERVNCKGSGRTAPVYGRALTTLLVKDIPGLYVFRPLEGVALNRRTELETGTLARVLSTRDPGVRRLLVSDAVAITLRERVSADYRISVEMSVRSFVDYFDLDPLKDGRYFWHEYQTVRTLEEWLAMNDAEFAEELATAARQTGCRVLAELAPQSQFPGSTCERSISPAVPAPASR